MSHAPQLVRDEAVDTTIRALGDWRRRIVLATVARRQCVDFDELVTQIASAGPETTDPVDDATQTEIEVTLHHHHLPELSAAGLIAYDSDDRTVERVSDAFNDEIQPVIDHLDELSTRD